MPLSRGDIALLGKNPGLLEIIAHTHTGGRYKATRSYRWRSSWSDRFNDLDILFMFQSLHLKSQMPAFSGALETHAFNLVLRRKYLIDYDFRLDERLKVLYYQNKLAVDGLVSDVCSSWWGMEPEMILLESPAVTDGLDAWKSWLAQINGMSFQYRDAESVASEKKRAEKVIRILETYPNGLDTRSTPNIKEILREFR
jgi:hypothetical protein